MFSKYIRGLEGNDGKEGLIICRKGYVFGVASGVVDKSK
jgi:hypothetical protein